MTRITFKNIEDARVYAVKLMKSGMCPVDSAKYVARGFFSIENNVVTICIG